MHDEQIKNLLRLSAKERYEYFIRYCADFEEVWGLVVGEDNWVIFKDHENDEIFPVWSHFDLAKICCFEEHKEMGATPQLIKLEAFIKKCIPNMISKNIYFGVFYNTDREGLAINGTSLKKALEDEVASVWE